MRIIYSLMISISKGFGILFLTLKLLNYLDLVIHHPYAIYPNIDYIKNISDIGLFAIIQYFIDKKSNHNVPY